MTMVPTPNIYSLVKGAGEANTMLNAFDRALLDAGIGDTNLVRMSSIVPPGALRRERINLPKGSLVPTAFANMESDKPGVIISAAVAVALPDDPGLAGVIMEYEAEAPLSSVEAKVRQMASDAFAHRNRKVKEIISTGIEHKVQRCGAVFAGAVLWYE